MGELAGKEDIPVQVIDHVHVQVLTVSGPPVSTDTARVYCIDVVGELVAVCRQEVFFEDVLQHQQLAIRQNGYRLFGIKGLIFHVKLSGNTVLVVYCVQQSV